MPIGVHIVHYLSLDLRALRPGDVVARVNGKPLKVLGWTKGVFSWDLLVEHDGFEKRMMARPSPESREIVLPFSGQDRVEYDQA